MPAKRRSATKQEIVDSFDELSLGDQEDILTELATIHRILKRERSRTAPLPTEWLTAPDPEKEQRLAMNTEYRDHEA